MSDLPRLTHAPLLRGRAKIGATTYLGIPGLGFHSVATVAVAADITFYEPFFVESPLTIDQLNLAVTTQSAGGGTARMALYAADITRQPTSLIVDAGTVAIDSPGHKSATISVTLDPGCYLKAFNLSAGATLRFFMGPNDTVATSLASTTPQLTQWQVAAAALAAFPNPGTVWNNAGFGNVGIHHFIIPRCTVVG